MTRSIVSLVSRFALAGVLAGSLGHPAAAEGIYVVQLASVKSEERAREEWSRLQARHAELLGDLSLMLQSADLGARGTFFRMQTGPFPNRATAEDMCLQLRAVKLDCLVAQRQGAKP